MTLNFEHSLRGSSVRSAHARALYALFVGALSFLILTATMVFYAPRSRFERESGVTTPSSKENALEAKILRFTGNLYFFTRGGVHFDHLFAILRNRFVLFRNGA